MPKFAGKVVNNEAKLLLSATTEAREVKKISDIVTGYTSHGLNQAIGRNNGRGVNIKEMWETIREPKRVVEQSQGAHKYVGQNATIVVSSEGKIITTYGKPRGPEIWDSSGVI